MEPVWRRRSGTLFVGLCLAWIVLHLAVLLVFGYGRDQGIYAHVARVILDGGMPYRDAWDFKPPGIFLLYAATRALLGPGAWAIRVIEALALAGMVLAMTRLARVLWNSWRAGLLAGALAVGVHVQMDFWHTAQPETFGGILCLVALLVATRPGAARVVAAGVLFGAAILCKPTLGGAAVVVAVWRGWEGWRAPSAPRRWRRAALPPLLLFAGVALPLLLCLMWFAATGALSAAREIFSGFAPAYTRLGWAGHDLVGLAWRAFVDWGTYFSSVLLVGMLLLLGLGVGGAERAGVLLVAATIAAQLIGMMVQAKYYAYHFDAIWPPTALLAGLGWWKLLERAASRGALAALAAFAFLVLALLARTAGPHDLRFTYGERLAGRLGQLAGRHDARTDELDSVFSGGVAIMHAGAVRDAARRIRDAVPADRSLWVWGFEPTLYTLTGMRSPTRYFYNQALRMKLTAAAARAELMRDLERDRPGAVVLVKRDGQSDVVGDSLDSFAALRTFPELDAFLKKGYAPLAELSYLTVLVDKQPR